MAKIKIQTVCPQCGYHHYVTVDKEDYKKYIEGEHVQNAFPYLSASDRELLVTGICENCWNEMFS